MAYGDSKAKKELVLQHARIILSDLAVVAPETREAKLLLRLVDVVEDAFDLGVKSGKEIGKES